MTFEPVFDGEDGGLGIQSVEDSFDQQQIDAALRQTIDRFEIGRHQLIEAHIARAGIIDVR